MTIVKRRNSIPDYGLTNEISGAFWGKRNNVTAPIVVEAEQE